MALSQSPTIVKLAERIIEQLKSNNEVEAASDEKEILAQATQLASQHGSEMSAESLATLAEDIQSLGNAANNRMIS